MTIEEATLKAHAMYAYETSEQADRESGDFDDLWQSLYDVCQIATYGIIDDIKEDEIQEAIDWLKETQSLTKDYKNRDISFGG